MFHCLLLASCSRRRKMFDGFKRNQCSSSGPPDDRLSTQKIYFYYSPVHFTIHKPLTWHIIWKRQNNYSYVSTNYVEARIGHHSCDDTLRLLLRSYEYLIMRTQSVHLTCTYIPVKWKDRHTRVELRWNTKSNRAKTYTYYACALRKSKTNTAFKRSLATLKLSFAFEARIVEIAQ